jgi:hypothetical protein
MAIEYDFDLGGPATTEAVADLLAHTAAANGLTHGEVQFTRPGADLDSGSLVSVSTPSPLPLKPPVEATFGFTPIVGILFRFDSSADTQRQEQDMIRLVVAVLAAFPGDAVLSFAGEIVRLLRRHGRVTISQAHDFWTPGLRALLLSPHDQATLPNM